MAHSMATRTVLIGDFNRWEINNGPISYGNIYSMSETFMKPSSSGMKSIINVSSCE